MRDNHTPGDDGDAQAHGSDAPRIEFPCDYPIKVMGDAGAALRSHVVEVMARHAPDFDTARVSIRDSRNGRYQAVTVMITATGKEQLESIFIDLKTSPQVRMVL